MSNGWEMVPLGEVLRQSEEVTEIDPTERYKEVTVRLWGKGVVLRGEVQGQEIAAARRFRLQAGQFILSRIDARNGALGIVPDSLDGAVVSNDFPAYHIVQSRLVAPYLGWLSRTLQFVDLCRAASEGTTNRVRLQEERFLRMTIPLPPLPEQRRIVAKVEELATKIDEARRVRQFAVDHLRVFAPAILSTGYDKAAQLAGGTERLGDLCVQITDGTHWTPHYVDTGVPFLSVKDITSGQISFDNVRYITRAEHEELTRRCKPERDDVLLTKVGTTGYARIIDVDREFSIFVSLALLKLRKDRLLPKFAEYMLNSSRLKDYSEAGTRGVGNKNLVLKFIREFPMPAPPLPEQRRIVAYLDDLQSKVDALKAQQAQSAAELDALLPSILDKAFKGAL